MNPGKSRYYTYVMLNIIIYTLEVAFIAINIRILYLIFYENGKIANNKSPNNRIKTLIVLGSGGHTTEMLRIVNHLSKERYSPRIYIYANADNISKEKVQQFEGDNKNYKILSIPRSRRVHQSYFTSIWSTLHATLISIPVTWNEKPDLLLCNGPGTCVPLCIIIFILKIFFLVKTKIIFVESFCRVKSYSLSGKVLYFIADNIIVQWSYLGKPLYTRIMIPCAKLSTESIRWATLMEDTVQFVPNEIKIHLITAINVLRDYEKNSCNFGWVNKELHRIESCLDRSWETLNSGHWKNVPLEYRYAYTLCSLIKAILLEIHSSLSSSNSKPDSKCLKEMIYQIDKGLLLGAPLPRNSSILTTIASRINEKLFNPMSETDLHNQAMPNVEETFNATIFPGFSFVTDYTEPSMETFYRDIFMKKMPAILKGCMKHWRALNLWHNTNYLSKVIGNRIVPIEIGSRYTEEDWTQCLITFSEFLKTHIKNKNNKVGYLAQHQLFDQIPELKNDFSIPEYCSFSDTHDEDNFPDINAWFGPSGTVSPLHFDPKNNLLCQVFGYKRIILYHPDESTNLYPYETRMLNNTAQVDPYQLDEVKFPNFHKANGLMCYLKPGEMLYIPPKWWHHVVSLSSSFSISFWWD